MPTQDNENANGLGQSTYLFFNCPEVEPETFRIGRVHGSEAISEPFRYEVEVTTELDATLNIEKLIGAEMSVRINMWDQRDNPEPDSRFISGVARRIIHTGGDLRYASYHIVLRPALYLLHNKIRSRIFLNQTVPDIVKSVYAEIGAAKIKNNLSKQYQAREYCVQYNESDFNFISRLMEQEGIFYYFKHASGDHTMVIADDADAYEPTEGMGALYYEPMSEKAWPNDEIVASLRYEKQVIPNKYVMDDYNFEPFTEQRGEAKGTGQRYKKWADFEIYEYPGRSPDAATLKKRAGIRMEESEAVEEVVNGQGACRGLISGHKVSFYGHPRSEVTSGSWVIRRLEIDARHNDYLSVFEAVSASKTYRPPRRAEWPRIVGTQTATVTYADSSADKYGRVKVVFHWDTSAQSCFVRVAQQWAGKTRGFWFLPRVDDEVVVTFLDGDPDRPLITGSVHNGKNTLPYPMPDKHQISTIKTKSFQASGFNEIRFDDTADAEELYFHAQKNMSVDVENNRTVNILEGDAGNDVLNVKKGNRTVTLDKGNLTTTVSKGNMTTTVGGKEDREVKGNRGVRVNGNETLEVNGNCTIKVQGKLKIEASRGVVIKSPMTIKVNGGMNVNVKAGLKAAIKATTFETKASGNSTHQASGNYTMKGGGMASLKGGSTASVESGGAASLKGGGAVTIAGSAISLG